MRRRRFVGAVGAACLTGGCQVRGAATPAAVTSRLDTDDWAGVRAAFEQDPSYVNLTGFLLMPHPKPVRDAIAGYRDRFDRNPVLVLEEYFGQARQGADPIRSTAAQFVSVPPDEIALTDSTTMGLGLVYSNFRLAPGKEALTTSHGHYSTLEALRWRSVRDGTAVRIVDLYADPARVSVDEVVSKLLAEVRPETRLVGVTWVHSSTGVKMPIRAMADALAVVNRQRAPEDRVFLCVDGVHGFGVENVSMADLGCDIFIAGCHKWICGPRGTGLVWANGAAWAEITPAIPPFEGAPFSAWLRGEIPAGPGGMLNTPGGFHSFEHRWALPEAFAFQTQIGRARIERRVHELNSRLKQGLQEISGVRLYTPVDPALSCGITCFDVGDRKPDEVVEALLEKRFIASSSPYAQSHARIAPSLLNDEAEVDAALDAVAQL